MILIIFAVDFLLMSVLIDLLYVFLVVGVLMDLLLCLFVGRKVIRP